MMEPRVFISFDFDHDENLKNLFVGQAKNSRTPFSIQDWSSKEPLPQYQWENLLKEKINKCHMMIVLVGRSMSTAQGVVKEIRFAQEQNVPYFGIYVDGANILSALPSGLVSGRIINWDWNLIASAINQMMGEGKNSN